MDNYQGQNEMPNGGMPNAGMTNGAPLETPLSLGEWLITLIVLAIPCVGLVMMFVWGFGEGNTSRKNYCRAALIMTAIGIVLAAIGYASFAAIFINALSAYSA